MARCRRSGWSEWVRECARTTSWTRVKFSALVRFVKRCAFGFKLCK